METTKYSFKLKSKLSELKALFQHIDSFGQVSGLSESLMSEINICLDELFTNIVLYGLEDDLEHFIMFNIKLDGNAITVNISDDGIPFNPLTKKDSELATDISKAQIGGLGIHIVKKLMDDIWYERKQGKNRLTLKKYIHAANYLYKSDKASKISSNSPIVNGY